ICIARGIGHALEASGGYLLDARLRRLGKVIGHEPVILMRIANRLHPGLDRFPGIVEQKGWPLLAGHGRVAPLALELLPYRIEAEQTSGERAVAVERGEQRGAFEHHRL